MDVSERNIDVKVVSGVEGPSLYINNIRVCGPKPWGGGTTTAQWYTSLQDILDSLPELNELIKGV